MVIVVIIIMFKFKFSACPLGFQEALVRQVRDLEELLGNGEFAWVRYLHQSSLVSHTPFPFLLFDFCLSGCRSAWEGVMAPRQANSARSSTAGERASLPISHQSRVSNPQTFLPYPPLPHPIMK